MGSATTSVATSGAAKRRVSGVDIAMLLLAVVSVGLLLWVMFFDTSPETAYRVFVIDTSICGVFAIEFLWRWRAAGWERRFPLRGWYEILGMIPIAHPALRGFRLLRIVVIVVRLARTADRAFGERTVQRLVDRFSEPIVKAIKKPITVAVLDEVVKVLETGNYPENLARSLGDHQEMLREIVTEKLKQDRQAGRLSRLPFHDEVVGAIVDTTIRVILDVLSDERIDRFFAEVVRENREQIRQAVVLGLHEEPDEQLEERLPTRPQRDLLS
ncbi:MAG: hypothetical protein ACRDT6_18005 [Micromonosporaceae bacterium]